MRILFYVRGEVFLFVLLGSLKVGGKQPPGLLSRRIFVFPMRYPLEISRTWESVGHRNGEPKWNYTNFLEVKSSNTKLPFWIPLLRLLDIQWPQVLCLMLVALISACVMDRMLRQRLRTAKLDGPWAPPKETGWDGVLGSSPWKQMVLFGKIPEMDHWGCPCFRKPPYRK